MKTTKSYDFPFSIAPMMDGTGTSQKAKPDQHLSFAASGHIVPNEVLLL